MPVTANASTVTKNAGYLVTALETIIAPPANMSAMDLSVFPNVLTPNIQTVANANHAIKIAMVAPVQITH